jgi:hypothetical protein
MRRWLLLLILVLAAPAARVGAQAAPDDRPRGSFECRDTPLRDALALLRAQSNLEIKLEEAAPNVPVTLALYDVPYEDILRVLVRQVAVTVPGVRVTRLGATYAVHRVPPPADGTPQHLVSEPLGSPSLTTALLRKVSVGFGQEGLRQALTRVFSLAGAQVSVEPNVPNVPITVNLRNGTLWNCLQQILESAQARTPAGTLRLGQIGEVYVVALLPSAAPEGNANTPSGRTGDRISLKLDEVPLKLAAEALFRGTGYRYTFTPDAEGKTVSLNLQEVPLDVALGRLAQEASRVGVRLTWTRE